MLARKALATLAVAGSIAAGTSVAQAAPGDLDTTFGNGGIARADFGQREFAYDIALQRDGKLVLAGGRITPATAAEALLAARLTATGQVDTGFGQGTGFRAVGTADTGEAVAVQPDGQILVAGYRSSGDVLVARFNGSDGLLDTSFASGAGLALLDYGASAFGRAMELTPGGQVVIGGTFATGAFTVRVNVPEGTKDLTFNPFDRQGMRESAANTSTAEALVLLPNGVPVTVGTWHDTIGGSSRFAVDWYNPTAGSSSSHPSQLAGQARAVVLQPDGKIVVAGYSSGATDVLVTRMIVADSGNVSLDESFGNRGVVRIDLGGTDVGAALALQPDGKIVVAGTTGSGATVRAMALRLQPSGIVDTTFGRNGVSVLPGPTGARQTIRAMALRGDGTILLAGSAADPSGSASQDLLVMRLEGDNGPGGSGGGGGGGQGGGGGGPAATPRCEGKRATIVGTRRGDRLAGTRRADVIVGLGGGDRINGNGGDDLICAGDGDDVVNGGPGNDRVLGGNGRDQLKGGAGKDFLAGQGGRDRLKGGPGADTLKGGPGRDVLLGGRGANTLRQ